MNQNAATPMSTVAMPSCRPVIKLERILEIGNTYENEDPSPTFLACCASHKADTLICISR